MCVCVREREREMGDEQINYGGPRAQQACTLSNGTYEASECISFDKWKQPDFNSWAAYVCLAEF